MTGQTGVATSWRVTQHRALFRQFVHDNVSKISYFQCSKNHHSLHCQVDKVLSANKPAMSFVEMSGEDFFLFKFFAKFLILFRCANAYAETKLTHKGARKVTCG